MQESGSAAWGYLLSHVERDVALRPLIGGSSYAGAEGLDLASHDVRVHVPEGAVPKDGPSAGLALAVAMLSALGGVPVKPRVAMTGEITLGGRILRVGGLKEKLLAAGRSGVRTVILPAANRGTVEELPAELTKKLELVYIASFGEAMTYVFGAPVFTGWALRTTTNERQVLWERRRCMIRITSTIIRPRVRKEEPGVDAGSGQLERHCSQCGALIEGSHEFCQTCAIQASGGEVPDDD